MVLIKVDNITKDGDIITFSVDEYVFWTNMTEDCVAYLINGAANGATKNKQHNDVFLANTCKVYQHTVFAEYKRDNIVGFVGQCNESKNYYFDTTGYLATKLISYDVISFSESGAPDIVQVALSEKKSAFVELNPNEDVERVSINFIIYNFTDYVLHCDRMYPAVDKNSQQIGYFNYICGSRGVFISLEQYNKYIEFQKFIQDKF
jgi:hypothetical protein